MERFIYSAVFFTGCIAMSNAFTTVESFLKHQVVPDMVPVGPEKLAKITYPSGGEVMEGNELTPTATIETPIVDWDVEDGALYAICMSDPDSPGPLNPIFREWLHWLVGNIPGKDIASGDTIAEYIGSGPPKDFGMHRQVFLIYKQSAKIEFTEERLSENSGAGRGKFSIAKFAEKYNMGNPVAGNFYQATYDDYVAILHKKLEITRWFDY